MTQVGGGLGEPLPGSKSGLRGVVATPLRGRIGAGGQRLVRAFADEAAALAHVRALLARRGNAMRRIGVAYR